jgi:hypothetical protein
MAKVRECMVEYRVLMFYGLFFIAWMTAVGTPFFLVAWFLRTFLE